MKSELDKKMTLNEFVRYLDRVGAREITRILINENNIIVNWN